MSGLGGHPTAPWDASLPFLISTMVLANSHVSPTKFGVHRQRPLAQVPPFWQTGFSQKSPWNPSGHKHFPSSHVPPFRH